MHSSPPSTSPVLPQARERSHVEPWRILLIELMNLLGLILTHARHARGARATAVLFEQIVGRLHILDKMPEHDGGMIVRRIMDVSGTLYDRPDYCILFGGLAFHGADTFAQTSRIPEAGPQLATALDQAFTCLHKQGIFAFYLQMPGQSIEKIDQLRLSLNILARFRTAVENNASITFHSFGRALSVPLINDYDGRPDPNLTVLAGLNGLSALNMRELIKQARAFCTLRHQSDETAPASAYNQIFGIRTLRSQLVQPLVEINNLPWMLDHCANPLKSNPSGPNAPIQRSRIPLPLAGSISHALHPSAFDLTTAYLQIYLDANGTKFKEAIDLLFKCDFAAIDGRDLANYVSRASSVLYALEKSASDDPLPFERFLSFLQGRLETIPEKLLAGLTMQRQAARIQSRGRTLVVGLIHPRLLDLIALVKERMATRRKIDTISDPAFDFRDGDLAVLRDLFEIRSHVFTKLKECFDEKDRFDRYRFAAHIDTFAHCANEIFEMLWCLLRHSTKAKDRYALIDALPLLIERLHEPRLAIAFLLSDLFQVPLQVEASDRNAFGLATQMLRTCNKERHTPVRRTPEEVLAVRKSLDAGRIAYVAWRMDIDAVRILSKFNAIQQALRRSVLNADATFPQNGSLGVRFLLALEREGLTFISLVGGKTARMVLRNAFAFYGDSKTELYRNPLYAPFLNDFISHLRIILRGLIRLGEPQDLDQLKNLEQSAADLMALDADPAFARRVKQTLQWVAPAMRAIQVRLR